MEHKREEKDLDSSTRLIKEAAERRGITFNEIVYYQDEVEHEIYELSYQGKSHLMDITSPDTTSSLGNTIADNKFLTHKMLDKLGAPCSPYEMFTDLSDALGYFETLSYPCVVKPIHGGGGDGVCVDISEHEEFKACFLYTKRFCEYVLVERYFEGSDTRFLTVDSKVVAVSRRDPGFVIGDGQKTLDSLVKETNMSRSEGRKGHLSKIRIDEIAIRYLNKQLLTMDSVPKENQKVYIRPNANLNTGGISSYVDIESVAPGNIKQIEYIAANFGLAVAGIDVITPDPSKPFKENGGIILEINDRPRIRMHEMPHEGPPVHVSEKIVDMLFKQTKKSVE